MSLLLQVLVGSHVSYGRGVCVADRGGVDPRGRSFMRRPFLKNISAKRNALAFPRSRKVWEPSDFWLFEGTSNGMEFLQRWRTLMDFRGQAKNKEMGGEN